MKGVGWKLPCCELSHKLVVSHLCSSCSRTLAKLTEIFLRCRGSFAAARPLACLANTGRFIASPPCEQLFGPSRDSSSASFVQPARGNRVLAGSAWAPWKKPRRDLPTRTNKSVFRQHCQKGRVSHEWERTILSRATFIQQDTTRILSLPITG
jgi:hypothetical protein